MVKGWRHWIGRFLFHVDPSSAQLAFVTITLVDFERVNVLDEGVMFQRAPLLIPPAEGLLSRLSLSVSALLLSNDLTVVVAIPAIPLPFRLAIGFAMLACSLLFGILVSPVVNVIPAFSGAILFAL
jgi:hypothetical protein